MIDLTLVFSAKRNDIVAGGTASSNPACSSGESAEVVWNDGNAGTGGGISDLFPVPAFQQGVNLPVSVNDGQISAACRMCVATPRREAVSPSC